LLSFAVITSIVQEKNSWDILADVTYETKLEHGYEVDFPIFGTAVKSIDGKEITLKGYMVPLENLLGSKYFMLSSLPFNTCFFCGGAGPETVIEVYTVNEVTFTDEVITVTGKLQLNESDPDHHMYILNNSDIQ